MSGRSAYEPTEVGEIPKDWEVVTLDDKRVSERLKAGGTPLRSVSAYYDNGTIPFVKIEDITRSGKYLSETETRITKAGLSNSSAWLVPKDSLLFSMYASFGEVVINKIPVATNQAIIALIPGNGSDLEYLYYTLKNLKGELHKHLRTTTQKNLNAEVVRRLNIPLPPLPEQQKIASILAAVDESIRKNDEIITKTQQLKKGLMQQLLTKGIGHTSFKQTEIGDIPEEWEVTRLGGVMIVCQYGLSVPLFETGEQPILRMNNFENGCVVPTDIKYANIDAESFKQFKLEKGDILFNRTNSYDLVGKVGIFLLDGDYTFASYLIRLRVDPDKADPFFINYYLNSDFAQSRLKSLATRGSSQSNINASNLRSVKIHLPTVSEQRKIASIIRNIDEKLDKERARKEQLERLKKGLMQVLLTGKFRVKVN